MKKIIITAITLALGICASAADFEVLSGSSSVLKDEAQAVVVFDAENATFQHEKTLEEESGDVWEERKALAMTGFLNGFNNGSKKGLKVVESSEEPTKYTIVFHIKNIDRKMPKGVAMAGSMSLVFEGSVDIVDNSTSEVVCQIAVNYRGKKGYYKATERIQNGFDEVGNNLAKIK